MAISNLERLIMLADEVFTTKSDPDQLDVNPLVIERLLKIHSSTIKQFDNGNGPVAWVLIIPTTSEIMNQFLKGEFSEKQLFEITPIGATYDALYLCSALVLNEYRRKGISRKLMLEAISEINLTHPLKALFSWPFTS